MKVCKRLCAFCLMIVLCMNLMACTQEEEKNEKVEGLEELGEIQVAAREEGSGTRSVFADLTGLRTEKDGEISDLTKKDAKILYSGEEILSFVSESKNRIGYMSLGTENENDNIKTLSVNGVFPDIDSIAKGKYPLGRTFYLVYSGKLSELEQNFLAFVRGKGQDIVSKTFAPIGKSTEFLPNMESGTIRIHGSTSMAPLMQELAVEYMRLNPNAVIEVKASDSGEGALDTVTGTCEFGMMSRELETYEKELLDYEAIAKDGIVVVVNKENPLTDISIEQLGNIYCGDIKNWEEINQ